MKRGALFAGALLALALSNTFAIHVEKAPPNPRALFPRIKNRREKFRPPKIIGPRNLKRGRR